MYVDTYRCTCVSRIHLYVHARIACIRARMHAYVYACINARSRTHTHTRIAAAMRGSKQGVTYPDKAVTGPEMRVAGRRDPSQAEPSSQDARGRQAGVSGRPSIRPSSTSRLSGASEVRNSPQFLDASARKEEEGHGQGEGGDRAGPHRARPSFGRSGGGGVGGRGGGGASRPAWVFDTASEEGSLPTDNNPSCEFITNVTEDRGGGQGGRGGGGGEEEGNGRGDGVGGSDGRGSMVGRRGGVERGRRGEEGAECRTGKEEGGAGAGGARGRRRAATPSRASEAPFPTTDSSSAAGSHEGSRDQGGGGRGWEKGGLGGLGGKGSTRTDVSERRRPSGGREGRDGDVFEGGGEGAGRGRGGGGQGEIERLQMEIVKMRQTFRQVLSIVPLFRNGARVLTFSEFLPQ
jgi:hypothetical protein